MEFQNNLNFYSISNFREQILEYEKLVSSDKTDSKLKTFSEKEIQEFVTNGFYIGEEKVRLGDYLSYTPLPFYIKRKWPNAKVIVHPNPLTDGFFGHNPYVDEINAIAGRKPIGAFRDFGFGNSPQRRLRMFGFFELLPLKPMLFISPEEKIKAQHWKKELNLGNRKLIFVHSSGRTVGKLLSKYRWSKITKALESDYYLVQIGTSIDQKIPVHHHMVKDFDLQRDNHFFDS